MKTAFNRIAAGLLTTTMLGGAAQADVKVGVLQSLSGTMAISEVTVKNAEMMAIDEINAAGGVMGKKIVPVVEDGASDPAIFAQKATKLVQERRRRRPCSAVGPRPAARRCCRCSSG